MNIIEMMFSCIHEDYKLPYMIDIWFLKEVPEL